MRQRGWTAKRQNVGLMVRQGKPVRFGSKGAADWLFIHPVHGVCEIEIKAESKKPGGNHGKQQLEYLAKRKKQGFAATWVNSVSMLEEWYAEQCKTRGWQ